MTLAPKAAPPAEALLAVSARALGGTVWAHGLTRAEAAELTTTWSRCAPQQVGTAEAPHTAEAVERGSGDWAVFHERFVYKATATAIASGRGHYMMFHAAAVSEQASGRSVALVASSGTGKTTATRVLGQHFGYLTDETVAVDPERVVSTFEKPLSLLPATGRRPKRQAGPDELGLLTASERPRLTRMAVLDRRPGLDAARVERLSLLAALEELAPQSSALASLDHGVDRLCGLLRDCGGAVRLIYSEAEQLIPVVRDLLAADPEPATDHWERLPTTVSGADLPSGADQYRRVPVDDAVAVDQADTSAVVLLDGEELTLLHGFGPLLWEECARWRSFEELLALVTTVAGGHPQARILLREQLAALQRRGLLEATS
ncbi:hypothetical protein [Zhihengliuella flava]|uniref:Uncharacterized protein n=1 Tax=Zhihengliuella flava TaxID=1285193 RepID=A0A931GEU4_9MICC|nr:hypothetical protein [Zhihengliuella flava]MBG6083942.1 hypothetical protein [Zhihengliuella flava]